MMITIDAIYHQINTKNEVVQALKNLDKILLETKKENIRIELENRLFNRIRESWISYMFFERKCTDFYILKDDSFEKYSKYIRCEKRTKEYLKAICRADKRLNHFIHDKKLSSAISYEIRNHRDNKLVYSFNSLVEVLTKEIKELEKEAEKATKTKPNKTIVKNKFSTKKIEETFLNLEPEEYFNQMKEFENCLEKLASAFYKKYTYCTGCKTFINKTDVHTVEDEKNIYTKCNKCNTIHYISNKE